MDAFDMGRFLRDIAAGRAPTRLDDYEHPMRIGGSSAAPDGPPQFVEMGDPITVCGIIGESIEITPFADRIIVAADDGAICADVHLPLDRAKQFHRALGDAIAEIERRAAGVRVVKIVPGCPGTVP